MADLDFDARRRERGQAEPHRVTVAGQAHELPAVLPTSAMLDVFEVIGEATGGDFSAAAEGDVELNTETLMAALPKLIRALSTHFGDWIQDLDFEEVMAILDIYGLGSTEDSEAGEDSAS